MWMWLVSYDACECEHICGLLPAFYPGDSFIKHSQDERFCSAVWMFSENYLPI